MIDATTYVWSAGGFVPLDAAREAPPKPRFAEGAIALSIDGQPILVAEEWDLVAQVWWLLVVAARDVSEGRSARFAYPDTPLLVELALDPASDVVTVSAARRDAPVRRATAPRAELVPRLYALARDAFAKLGALAGGDVFARELEQIQALTAHGMSPPP